MRAFLVLVVIAALAPACVGYDCNGNPTTLFKQVEQGVAAARANPSGVSTQCYTLTPPPPPASSQAVSPPGGSDGDAGDPCAPVAGDDACVACLKSACCAAAADGYDPAVRCGLSKCAACGGAS